MGMDHYKIVKQLGGTTGTFLAVDKQDETKKVVIKRLLDGTQGVQELNVSLRVRHPNIIPFLESFVHEGALYVVLAYAEGGDLEAYLERLEREKKPPPLALVLRWFKQLLEALRCCHEQNIMHRDVKPGNIFLNADATELYLGDFGSAKTLLRSVSLTSTFVGTPIWISPELLTGTPYSYPSDVWSLGCVFYEMVALRRPFAPSSFANLVQQITSGDIAPLPATVPEDVRAIVTQMLQVDPGRRCSLARALELTERAMLPAAVPDRSPPLNIPKRAAGASPKRQAPPAAPPRRPSPSETQEAAPAADVVVEKRLADWIHARNNDFSLIERYLGKFRQSDDRLLAATTSSVEDFAHDRGVGRHGETASPKRVATPSAARSESVKRLGPERVNEVRVQALVPHHNNAPPALNAVKSRRRIFSTKGNLIPKRESIGGGYVNRNASPFVREPSAPQHLNGNAFHAFKRIKSSTSAARHNSPSLQPPPPSSSPSSQQQQQQEEERQHQREKREQERAKMLEMIREQKAKAIQERKAKGKREPRDALAVEIVLPDNVRYVGGV